MDDPHGQPPLITSASDGHAGNARGGMRRRLGALGGAQLCRARARIGGNLLVAGVTGRLVRMTKARRGLRDFRQMPRSAAGLGAFDQEILDDAVFQRMKRHHHQPAARLQHALRRRQRQMQFVEFFVDEDPQGLERPRRRMNFARLRPHHLRDDIGQRARGRDRRFLARGDDGAGDGARMTLFAEDVDDVGEIGLGRPRDHIGRGRAVMAHPHVERTVEAKREAALGLVELHRGHPDIHHDAVDRRDTLRGADLGEIGEAVLDQGQPAVRPIDQIEAAGNGGAVAVDADDPGSRDVEDGAAVAAGPEGGVDIDAAVARARASRPPRGQAREYDAGQPDSCAGSGRGPALK